MDLHAAFSVQYMKVYNKDQTEVSTWLLVRGWSSWLVFSVALLDTATKQWLVKTQQTKA